MVHELEGDISPAMVRQFAAAALVACDIETTGLRWDADRIATFQLHCPTESAFVRILDGQAVPPNLVELLGSSSVRKVFHHAMFDLRFIRHEWGCAVRSVACTKIASKIVRPERSSREHSLQSLLQVELGITIDKTQQASDWAASALSPDQVNYALNDVRHLSRLLSCLERQAEKTGRTALLQSCWEHLPTRVELEVGAFGDVYNY
jgi:ribonuclease D